MSNATAPAFTLFLSWCWRQHAPHGASSLTISQEEPLWLESLCRPGGEGCHLDKRMAALGRQSESGRETRLHCLCRTFYTFSRTFWRSCRDLYCLCRTSCTFTRAPRLSLEHHLNRIGTPEKRQKKSPFGRGLNVVMISRRSRHRHL